MLLNWQRAQSVMERLGLDALIAATPVNCMYLSDFPNDYVFQFGNRMFGVLPRGAATASLVIPESRLNDLAVCPISAAEVRTFGAMYRNMGERGELTGAVARLHDLLESTRQEKKGSWQEALVTLLRDLGLDGARVGIDWLNPVAALQAAGCNAHFVVAEDAFKQVRAVKTADELRRLTRSAEIAELAMQAAMRELRPGLQWLAVKAAFDMECARHGAQPRFWTSGGGANAAATFHPTPYQLQRGDMVRFDCGGCYEGYCSDTGRVAMLGQPTEKMKRLYAALVAGMEAAQRAMRPGATGGEVFAATVAAVRGAGIPDYERHNTGHGIGLEQYDLPSVTAPEQMVLEPGMTLNIEVPFYDLSWGGLQLEDTFVVTESGSRRLTSLPWVLFPVQEVL